MSDKVYIGLEDLKPDELNPRRHTYRNMSMIADSLRRFGANRGIVIDENGVVLAGNGLVEAAAEVGFEKIRVIDVDGESLVAVKIKHLTDDQKQQYAIADNRTGELSGWDVDALRALVDDGVDLDMFWTNGEWDALVNENSYVPKLDPSVEWSPISADDIDYAEDDKEKIATTTTTEDHETECPNCGKTFMYRLQYGGARGMGND